MLILCQNICVTSFFFFCDSRFINVILISSVYIENSALQAVPKIKNTLVGHFSELCVCLCVHAHMGCYMALLGIFTWYSVGNCVSVVSVVTRLLT